MKVIFRMRVSYLFTVEAQPFQPRGPDQKPEPPKLRSSRFIKAWMRSSSCRSARESLSESKSRVATKPSITSAQATWAWMLEAK